MKTRKTKRCPACGKTKIAKYFYEGDYFASGLSSYCRKCSRLTTLDWRKRNPEKRRAHQIVVTALRNKEVIRPSKCKNCKRITMVVAHHPDYKKPLNIIWLCDSCHFSIHVKARRKNNKYGINGKLGGKRKLNKTNKEV